MHKMKMIRPLLFIALVCVSLVSFSQQSNLDKKISLTVSDKSVYYILEQIEKAGELSFSFKTGLFDKNKKVSITITKATIREVLEQLLKDKSLFFYELADMVIIYRPSADELKNSPKVKENPKVRIYHRPHPAKINQKIVTVYDTCRVLVSETILDTLQITDSVVSVVYDTVVVNDTIQSFVHENEKSWLWFVGANVSMCYDYTTTGMLNQYQEQAFTPLPSMGGGFSLSFRSKNLGLETGIGLLNSRYSFSINEEIGSCDSADLNEDGCWEKFLVDEYYYYSGTDTLRVEIWDSVFVPNNSVQNIKEKDSLLFSEQVSNFVIEFPLIVHCSFPLSANHTIGLSSGLVAGFYIKQKYWSVTDDNGCYKVEDVASKKTISLSLNSRFSLLYRYSHHEQFYFQFEPFVSFAVVSDLKIPSHQTRYGFALSAGLPL